MERPLEVLLDLSVTPPATWGPAVLETPSPSSSIVLVSWLLSAEEARIRPDLEIVYEQLDVVPYTVKATF